MVGKRPEFCYKDSDSGEMTEHFDLKGRDCVKDYSEFKDSYGKTRITAMETIWVTTVKFEQGFGGINLCMSPQNAVFELKICLLYSSSNYETCFQIHP